MPIKQQPTFNNMPISSDGSTVLNLEAWVMETLTAEEQAQYTAAEQERVNLVQAQIDLGHLTIDEETGALVWADGAETSSIVPEAWYAFFQRYITENNITFTDNFEDI